MIKYYNSLSWRLGTRLKTREPGVLGKDPTDTPYSTKSSWLTSAFMLLLLLVGITTEAQVASYSFTATTGTYTELSGTATPLALVQADSYMSPAQTIPFTFTYDGVGYTQFKRSSNGVISFNMAGTSNLTSNDFSTANATSRPIIAPLWDDLDGRSTGSYASYEVSGTAPNRVFTIEWRNWEWNR